MSTFNFVVDENMPLVEDLFGHYGTIKKVNGRTLNADDLTGADILLVRSVTQVNRSLLENNQIKFVGSATIGTDHVDQSYLAGQGIHFAHAPGCNANSVVQYVLSALAFAGRLPALLEGKQQLAIVGVGNVGSRLARACDILAIPCQLYDPPREANETTRFHGSHWEQIIQSDVISLHVPLTFTGSCPTHHLLDQSQLQQLLPGTLLINSSRGAVIDNAALTARLKKGDIQAILDVFEHEPEISAALRARCLLATPHIAGYSKQGKEQGTKMIYQAFLACFDLEDVHQAQPGIMPSAGEISWNNQISFAENLASTILATCAIEKDSIDLKQLAPSALEKGFDKLRKNYKDRHEFPLWTLKSPSAEGDRQRLSALGFNCSSCVDGLTG